MFLVRADIVRECSQGLKPLAESRHPFGISPRVPKGQKKRTGRYGAIRLAANGSFLIRSKMCEHPDKDTLRSDKTEFRRELSWLSLF